MSFNSCRCIKSYLLSQARFFEIVSWLHYIWQNLALWQGIRVEEALGLIMQPNDLKKTKLSWANSQNDIYFHSKRPFWVKVVVILWICSALKQFFLSQHEHVTQLPTAKKKRICRAPIPAYIASQQLNDKFVAAFTWLLEKSVDTFFLFKMF